VDEPRVLRWETLTKQAFDALDPARCVVLVTCSPLEVHGPHLPLGADALEGQGLALRMLRFLPERHRARTFLQLPLVYAATDVVPQRGSLFFRSSTTRRVLEDLGNTLAAQGFRDVFVSNFHGSPRHFLAIEAACERVNRRRGTRMVSLFSLMIARLTQGTSSLDAVLGGLPGVHEEDLVDDTHGGLVETSQLLALHGEWVDPGYAKLPRRTAELMLREQGEAPAPRGGPRDASNLFGMLREIRAGIRFFQRETYSGAPARASAELGERILDTLGREAANACAEILDGTLAPGDCHSPVWRLRFLFLNPLAIRVANRLLGFRNPIV
jgi:creatinine amidohydrolase